MAEAHLWIRNRLHVKMHTDLQQKQIRGIVVLQWNPVNTVTNRPQKFGRINGVGSNFIT